MQKRSLQVALLEVPLRFGRVAEALAQVDHLLEQIGPVDLVLLPETALTGYVSPWGDFDLRPFAEPLEGETARALSELAARYRVALAGPLVERTGEHFYNTLLLFAKDGRHIGHWRKRHPWYPERWASPGDLGGGVVEIEGVRVTAGICFDIHFLAEDAPQSLTRADLLLFPSAWVESSPEEDSRPEILSSLARAFHIAVLNANWGYAAPFLPGQGGSMILDCEGQILARTHPGRTPQVLQALLTFP